MCSLSWFQTSQSIVICFNRDEQRKRSIAKLPQVYSNNDCKVLMPLDRDAAGTWLIVNEQAICICLLNLYENELKEERVVVELGEKRSRGLLVRELSDVNDFESFNQRLINKDLMLYLPFRLVFISLLEKYQFVWDGKKLERQELSSFTSSTSYLSSKVLQKRQEHFAEIAEMTKESLINLHSKHSKGGDEYSICMHRDDAKTVSMSLIEINHKEINYQYWDGSPCEQENIYRQKLTVVRN